MTTGPSVIRKISAASDRRNFGKDALGSPTEILKAKFSDKVLASTCVRRAIQLIGREDAVIQVVMRSGEVYSSTKDLLRDVFLFEDGKECVGPCISTPTAVKSAHHSGASLPTVNSSRRESSKNSSSATSSLPMALDHQSQAAQGAPASTGRCLESATRSLMIADDLQELRRLLTCKICLDELVTITFVPCGHLVSCASCAPALRECPICRVVVRGTVRTAI